MTSTEALESSPNPALPVEEEHTHAHEGHDGPGHTHGPVLNPDCTRQIELDVPAEEVSKTFRGVVKRYQKMARVPGFRSGKVPESYIRSRFADSIRQDVIEALLPEQFRAAVEREGLRPVSQPQVTGLTLADGEALQCKAIFEVVPPIDVKGYDSIRVEKPATELTEEEYQAELDRVRDSHAAMEPVAEDRALADGDWAQISFHGDFQAEAAPEGENPAAPEPVKGEDVLIEVGGKNTLDSFNQALRGAKPGQQLKFEASYPEDFSERRLAGKTVVYDVEVKAIKKKILPELNDDFARELGEYEKLEDFTAQFREHLAQSKRRRLEAEAKDKMMESLVAKFEFAVPESLVQQQVDARLERGLRALAMQGMRADDMRKLDFDRLRVAQRDSALAEVKGSLVLDRIADEEKVEVSDQEVEQQLQVAARQAGESVEALRARLTEDGGLARIREQLRREKTGQLLYEKLAS